jgi:predicted metallo-beta-lactamase superfamily hydrolase
MISSLTEDRMKKLMAKLEDIMVAITFAESGEYEEAIKQSRTAPDGQEGSSESLSGLKQPVFENSCK